MHCFGRPCIVSAWHALVDESLEAHECETEEPGRDERERDAAEGRRRIRAVDLSRSPAKSRSARPNPTAAAKAKTTDFGKLARIASSRALRSATPRTAQFVVMSGR